MLICVVLLLFLGGGMCAMENGLQVVSPHHSRQHSGSRPVALHTRNRSLDWVVSDISTERGTPDSIAVKSFEQRLAELEAREITYVMLVSRLEDRVKVLEGECHTQQSAIKQAYDMLKQYSAQAVRLSEDIMAAQSLTDEEKKELDRLRANYLSVLTVLRRNTERQSDFEKHTGTNIAVLQKRTTELQASDTASRAEIQELKQRVMHRKHSRRLNQSDNVSSSNQ